MPVEGHLLAQIFIHVPQRQRQVAQHTEPTPPRQTQYVLQVAVYDSMIIRFAVFFNVIQVKMFEFFACHMHGADNKVQLWRLAQQFLRPVKAHGRLAQLRPQPDGQPPGVCLPRLRQLPQQPRPVEMLPGPVVAPQHRVHVVRHADLVQPGPHRRFRQLTDRQLSVRRRGRVGMIVRQIHPSPAHFFLKKLLRFS